MRKDLIKTRKRKGFTLIELLIVVAVIGLLAALLLPNVLGAIQKSKQKATMRDMNVLAVALTDFVTNNGTAPAGVSGDISQSNTLTIALAGPSGLYLKAIPLYDQWGNGFRVYTGTDISAAGIDAITDPREADFVIWSFGRDKIAESIPYTPADPTTAYFGLTGMSSFNNDLVLWNGSWIRVPKTPQVEH